MTSAKQVFISYSQADTPHLLSIKEIIENYGARPWTDQEIPGAEDISDTVNKALLESCAIIVIVTAISIKSAEVRREVTFCLENNIPILAVVMQYDRDEGGDIPIPKMLAELNPRLKPNLALDWVRDRDTEVGKLRDFVQEKCLSNKQRNVYIASISTGGKAGRTTLGAYIASQIYDDSRKGYLKCWVDDSDSEQLRDVEFMNLHLGINTEISNLLPYKLNKTEAQGIDWHMDRVSAPIIIEGDLFPDSNLQIEEILKLTNAFLIIVVCPFHWVLDEDGEWQPQKPNPTIRFTLEELCRNSEHTDSHIGIFLSQMPGQSLQEAEESAKAYFDALTESDNCRNKLRLMGFSRFRPRLRGFTVKKVHDELKRQQKKVTYLHEGSELSNLAWRRNYGFFDAQSMIEVFMNNFSSDTCTISTIYQHPTALGVAMRSGIGFLILVGDESIIDITNDDLPEDKILQHQRWSSISTEAQKNDFPVLYTRVTNDVIINLLDWLRYDYPFCENEKLSILLDDTISLNRAEWENSIGNSD